jgi:hypothetical protein
MPGIIILIVVILVGAYFGIRKLESQRKEKENISQQTQEFLIAQQKEIESAKQEIEKLKSENKDTNQKINEKVNAVEQKINTRSETESNDLTIQASEINPYLMGVGEIMCYGSNPKSGSASIWNFDDGNGYALTNKHVVSGDGNCNLIIDGIGIYRLDKTSIRSWNSETDVALLKILLLEGVSDISAPISELNYKISYLRSCTEKMSLGSSIMVVGFPAFSETNTVINGTLSRQSSRTITNGIISAYDGTIQKPIGNLPAVNYFVSAKIDSGNSGGMVFSKDKNGLCVLGIPTWLSLGNFETQGLVQNIYNVMYKQ